MGKARGLRLSAGRTIAFGVLVAIAFLTGCGKSTPSATRQSPTSLGGATPVSRPHQVDAGLSLLFARIAGLAGPGGPVAPWQTEAEWKAFAELSGRAWSDFSAAVLEPMRAWAGAELGEARAATSSLFYPFGGPDFVTSDCLFPEASTTILMGLEPVGNLPDFDHASAAWRGAFFTDLGELASGFLQRGYFITREMNDIYSRGKVDGALPVIAFFIGRGGYGVVEIKRLAPGASGGWVETPYAPMALRPHRPYGVKIVFRKPGETVDRTVYYFSCDVENKAFPIDGALYRLLAGLDRMTTFVKSGSYLLHWENFSTLRRFILDRSRFVLQDDTAVPYRFFKAPGWQVRLFGRYAVPVKDFTNVEQPDLREAYEDPDTGVEPLPFHFGYHWRTQVDNLLLARQTRRAYKSPVLR
jgi:hypothetical protein